MEKKKRFIIVDALSLLHRAFHALPALSTGKGILVNAVYGFLLIFLKVVNEFHPDFIAVAFDTQKPTFRHRAFSEYKAKRPKVSEEFYRQIPELKKILKVFNVPVFEKEGFEADDLIGTLAAAARKAGSDSGDDVPEVVILSSDNDFLQLVKQGVSALILKRGLKETVFYQNNNDIAQKYPGLVSEQLVDFKALRGDPSDNIPGVRGVGEKTTLKLIKQFGSLENLYSALNQRPLPKAVLINVNQRLRALLEEYKEQAFLSKKLAKICDDIPMAFSLKECRWGGYDREKAAQVLKDLHFFSLVSRLP